ncbi:uncharacterized protein LOC131881165 isoform X2 [Tigriopus californicus]|uniref:uncharacterized protein LOC131881165 isoform X2 n=1 Tax=Tigriopus californicus TaxID=6832 RepID=UPI0027DA580E|nr:uncharacterized protein LOC131881165 isoform X2 [Tigriopus californicus]
MDPRSGPPVQSQESLNQSREEEGEETRANIRDILQDQWRDVLFSGWYADRILWKEDRGLYRDRLVIDACETTVIRHAKSLYRKLRRRIPEGQVCGMAKTDDGSVALFVDWPRGQHALGHYWFLIQAATFSPELGVDWRIKVIRSVLASDQGGASPCPHCGKWPVPGSGSAHLDQPWSTAEIYRQFSSHINLAFRPGEWVEETRPYLSLNSLVNGLKFVMVFLMALTTGHTISAGLPRYGQQNSGRILLIGGHDLAGCPPTRQPKTYSTAQGLEWTGWTR